MPQADEIVSKDDVVVPVPVPVDVRDINVRRKLSGCVRFGVLLSLFLFSLFLFSCGGECGDIDGVVYGGSFMSFVVDQLCDICFIFHHFEALICDMSASASLISPPATRHVRCFSLIILTLVCIIQYML